MSTNNTQLTSAIGYKTERMIFSDPVPGAIPNSTIKYTRVNISTLNEDGTTGELILPTTELFSFGVSENKDPATQKVNGYVLPLCLWNRDGPSDEEKAWTDTFDAIVEKCKDHLIQNREELEQYDLTRAELKKLNPLYFKKGERGKILTDKGPTLYAKLIQAGAKKAKGKDAKDSEKGETRILTAFFDENDEPLNPMDLLGKYCFAKAAIKIESIFIGSKISLQIKLYEVNVRLMASSMKRLLPRPKVSNNNRLMTAKTDNPMSEMKSMEDAIDDIDDAGSIHGDSDAEEAVVASDEEEEAPPKKESPKKKVPRKVKPVKAKK